MKIQNVKEKLWDVASEWQEFMGCVLMNKRANEDGVWSESVWPTYYKLAQCCLSNKLYLQNETGRKKSFNEMKLGIDSLTFYLSILGASKG